MNLSVIRSLAAGFALAVGSLYLMPAALADSISPAETRRTISVSARGEVSVPPDRAVVSIAVETVHRQAEAAVAENAERSERVAKAARALLGAADRVSTTRYSLQPRYEHPKGEAEARIVGYVASNEVRIETADIDAVGRILDASIRAGANRVGSLQFTIAERDSVLRDALDQAGRRARAQAETIAASLDVTLGPVVSATSSDSGPILPHRAEMFALARDGMAQTPIEAGDVKVTADVHVVFEIR